MKDWRDCEQIYPTPAQRDGGRMLGPQEAQDKVNDESACDAYRVPWNANGHLAPADDDFDDAVWNVTENRRYARQLESTPDTVKGKK